MRKTILFLAANQRLLIWVIVAAMVAAVLLPVRAAALTSSTTTLGASPNPAVFGAAVTLTATVSPSAATGKVTFYDGVTVLGVATLSSGQAARREPQGPPEGVLEIVNGDVYVRADHDVSLSGLAFSLGSADGAVLRWTPAESLAPSLLDSSTPGALAVAWLEGVTLRGGERLRLGRVDGSASLTVYGISANESEKAGGREVRLVGRAEK